MNAPTQPITTEKKRGYQLPKPYLLTRMGAALLDFILVALLFVGVQTALYYTLFDSFGYHRMLDEVQTALADSHLFSYSETDGYQSYKDIYDDEKTPDENYDGPITAYYSSNDRALNLDLLGEYEAAKLASGYFELDGSLIVRIEDSSDEDVKAFYEAEYAEAQAFFRQDPIYYNWLQKTFRIMIFTSLFSVTLTSAIIYLLFPLLRKNGDTPTQMLFKICLADGRDDTRVKRSQIVIRYVILLLFNIWIPLLLYAQFNSLILVSVFVTLIMMTVTKSFSGPHDYISKTYIVSRRDIEIPSLIISKKPDKDIYQEEMR